MNRPLKKINTILTWSAIAALALFVIIRGQANITDEDTRFHLKAGEYIAQHGIPTTDVFSFSIAGKKWIDHEWLWQIFLHAVQSVAGEQGLLIVQTMLALAIWGIMTLVGYRKGLPFLTVALSFYLLLSHAAQPLMRPDIPSLLFCLLYVCLAWNDLKKPWIIGALIGLQIIWTNIHGFFILGPALVWILILGEFLKRRVFLPFQWNQVGRLDEQEYRRLLWIGWGVLAACLVNPQFISGVWYPIQIVLDSKGNSKFLFEFISELNPPINSITLRDHSYFAVYKSLILGSALSFIVNWRRIDLRILFLWGLFFFFAWTAVRNLLFFEVAAVLTIVINFSNLPWSEWANTSWPLRSLVALVQCILIVSIIQNAYSIATARFYNLHTLAYESSNGHLTDYKLSRQASDFLAVNQVSGNFFNNLQVGHYINSRHFPKIKSYIDGRTELFGTNFFKNYLKIVEDDDWGLFEKLVSKFNITGVYISTVDSPFLKPFVRDLYRHPEWKLVYFNWDALIFLRDADENKSIIDRNAVNLKTWKNPAEFHGPQEAARMFFNRGAMLSWLGESQSAIGEFNQAIALRPNFGDAYHLLGKAYEKIGNLNLALENLNKARTHRPYSLTILNDLGLLHLERGELDDTQKIIDKIASLDPLDTRSYWLKSKLFARKSAFKESFETLVKANNLKFSSEDTLALIDIYIKEQAYSWAQKACELALPRNPKEVGERLKFLSAADVKARPPSQNN